MHRDDLLRVVETGPDRPVVEEVTFTDNGEEYVAVVRGGTVIEMVKRNDKGWREVQPDHVIKRYLCPDCGHIHGNER